MVLFEQFTDGVDMYESTRGLVVTDELPARRLVATFPIVRESADAVVVDFNQGMRRVIFDEWYGMDEGFSASVGERAAEVPQARVFELRREGPRMIIRQSVQARNRAHDTNREQRFEVRYFLAPYVANGFEAAEMDSVAERYTRFFEAHPQLEPVSGRSTRKIVRFDHRQPIVFYYSANTPEAARKAVADGIEYWNGAFGKEVLEARLAPEGVTAPDASHNLVQWVPWDNAGFAYADVLLDPHSGEAYHGQAYMTSVFYISGKARARRVLRALHEIAEAEKARGADAAREMATSLFGSQAICRMDPLAFARQYAKSLQDVLADPAATDAVVERMSLDYVSEVVAHEVGHVLGLRHNFAGNIGADLSPAELDKFIEDYIREADLSAYADKKASTSTMEYSNFKAAVFTGWKMRTGKAPMEHDAAAIRWGYFQDPRVVEEKMLFATDADRRVYGDVAVFDYGTDPVQASYHEISSTLRDLPKTVIEIFIRARAPQDPRDRVPLEQVRISSSDFAQALSESYRRLLSWFDASTRSLKVENAFAYVGELNLEERQKAHWEQLQQNLEQAGGVDRVAFAFLPLKLDLEPESQPQGVEAAPKVNAQVQTAQLKELLETPAYASFVGLDDETYTWTEEEKAIIVRRAGEFFEKFERDLVKVILQTYEKAPRDLGFAATRSLGEDDVTARLEKRIVDAAREVILARDESRTIQGKVDQATVLVREFKYDHETRLAAAKALNDETGSFSAWSKEAKAELHEKLKEAVQGSLGIDNFKDFKDSMLSRSLREWHGRNQAILKLLPPGEKKNGEGDGKDK